MLTPSANPRLPTVAPWALEKGCFAALAGSRDSPITAQRQCDPVLEIKGLEDEQDRAKHEAARRWRDAVNNWGKLGQWEFHVCKEPQGLMGELQWFLNEKPAKVTN